ncbi:MAG: hypothetical protein LBC96_05980 [Lachnospiraceae bacterium]|nr:hypothetical protein [Lachnospiraceae bacterium]
MYGKIVKPKIEDVINDALFGDALKNALDFVLYLRENKMNPVWSATNAWKVSYKTYTVCFIRLHGSADYHNLEVGSWHIIPFIGEYEADSLSNDFKEIAWANKKTCGGCGKCALELIAIFGRKFDYACEGSIRFINPDANEVECAKKLVELRRCEIKEGKAKKHQYIAMKDRNLSF